MFDRSQKANWTRRCSPLLIKNCAFSLARPLWLIFNKSLSSGVFPKSWKTSFVVPIFKNNGDVGDVENYRPITLMSQFPKILESLVNDYLSEIFSNVITTKQHGFVKGLSITTNLAVYGKTLSEALEGGKMVDVVYTDLSKAFDRVDHGLLIDKLSAYGVGGSLILWIYSYLVGRKQIVKIKSFMSVPFEAIMGVPQGGHLAPLLFIVFINDIFYCFHYCLFLLYADDLKVFKILDNDGAREELQDDLQRLHAWCELNGMVLNVDKCKHMFFSRQCSPHLNEYNIGGKTLQTVNQIKDLGVIFDSKLSFVEHISMCCNKALKMLGFVIRHTKYFNSLWALRTLYVSLVRTHLENNSIVWSPFYQIHVNAIERVQRKFLRHINFKLGIPAENINYKHLMQMLKIQPMSDRHKYFDKLFICKIINNEIVCPELMCYIRFHVPARTVRDVNTFSNEWHRTIYGSHNTINRCMTAANEINEDVFNTPFAKIKQKLKSQLCDI